MVGILVPGLGDKWYGFLVPGLGDGWLVSGSRLRRFNGWVSGSRIRK